LLLELLHQTMLAVGEKIELGIGATATARKIAIALIK
jgi:hypothetical protein